MNKHVTPTDLPPATRARRTRRPRPGGKARVRARMSPQAREEMILSGAVAFFAKNGFAAQTRDLAREIGVSQSLIYHYFRTKDDLVERVYERAFLSRWRGEWEPLLRDRSRPLAQRLKAFYASYLVVIDDADWIRLVMFSELQGSKLARRYVEAQINGLLRTIAQEFAATSGTPGTGLEPEEIELVWHLHSTFIYYVIRKHILETATIRDLGRLIDITVDHFMKGIAAPCAGRKA